MKYIRTKDSIYKLEIAKEFGIEDLAIKQADAIEELCDEAVFFDNKNKPHYQSQEGSIWYLGAGLYTETLRFGIYTDKGLIYVAKMNEEEELELL